MFRKLFLTLAAALLLLPIDLNYAAQPSPADVTAMTALPAPKADPIRIVPPADMVPGEDYDLAVTGLSVNDLVPGRVLFLPPEAAGVRCKLMVVWSLAGLEPQISFRAKAPGSYRIVIVKSLANEQLLAAQAVVVVGGPQPDPFPDPKPVKLVAVAIVEETADRPKLSPTQRALLGNASFRKAVEAKSLKFRQVDKDDQLPAEWQWAVKAAGAKLPALCFSDGSASEAIPLPADESAALREIEGRVQK